jgi:tRNA (cytidine/uridine-2'-O-)-methyltransferase
LLPNHPQICLFNPEIPQNTGNIGRLLAATQGRLHLVKPFGFSMDDKNVRRAGLDYWPFLDVEIHENFANFQSQFNPEKIAYLSKFATKSIYEIPTDNEVFVFGCETSGLPDFIHEQYPDNLYRIPMFHSGVRSLNLANAVSIVMYEQLRKRNLFKGQTIENFQH